MYVMLCYVDFVAGLGASRPKKLTVLAKKLVKSTCSKSNSFPVPFPSQIPRQKTWAWGLPPH